MLIITTKQALLQVLKPLKQSGKTVGFVPTMGALHAGHLSLIAQSKTENDLTVCSIFVNPTQFNNPDDLEKYPRTTEADIRKLEAANCDLVFLPKVEEMYPVGETAEQYELGELEHLLEGKYRPGHYQGVAMIVDKLLSAVQPSCLYLGIKDYQQIMVIKKMMAAKRHPATVSACPTLREADGLAMSSRNMRLNQTQRAAAATIFKVLNLVKEQYGKTDIAAIKQEATTMLEAAGFRVDYVSIADAHTLQELSEYKTKDVVSLIAAYIGDIRLIDNLQIA